MKKACCLLIVVSFLWQGCQSRKEEVISYDIVLQNPLNIQRNDEAVVFSYDKLQSLVGEIPADKIPVFQVNGNPITSQIDDLNDDGEWDEALLLYSFQPNETVNCQVIFISKENFSPFSNRTDAALFLSPNRDKTGYQRVKTEVMPAETSSDFQKTVLSYQMEGPAWENDKVAFRSYFDYRNGKDIFGKVIADLCLDTIGRSGDYHQMQYWGMDILKVGNSLGAGALAVLENNQLFRLGKADEIRYEFVTSGPIRSMIRLHYKGWKFNNNNLNVVHQISIYAGKYAYRSDVTMSGYTESKELVSGIVTMKLKDTPVLEETKSFVILATHDKQSELTPEPDYLGMGLLVPKQIFIGQGNAPVKDKWEGDEIVNTYYARMQAAPNTPITFYFYAGWEKSNPDFANKSKFLELLRQDAECLSNPIIVNKASSQ
ncbi:MAG: DUF4861 domain-containing protein [Cytophagales bacterium]|nr:DUF4861 domain-containing protein [Cytophagales bacterium]MDW8383468.1 DUF4861 domain-containing protein [Flammeovirgaceae bacterium]